MVSAIVGRCLVMVGLLAVSLWAQPDPTWTEPFPPFEIVGNLYYVGSRGLASYLVTAPQGHILINSNLESSVPQIRQSVDIFLGAHGSYYNMEAKFAKLKSGDTNPFVDPEGYQNFVAEKQQAFRSELAKQTVAKKSAS